MKKLASDPFIPVARATIVVPGGRARLLAEIVESGDSETGDIVLQALERNDGFQLIRVGYRRNGRMVRGPVSVSPRTWKRLISKAGADAVIAPLIETTGRLSTGGRQRA